MLSKFNKNSIITGPLDSYCLICESYLRDGNEMDLHITKPIHMKNLETVPYFDKYKEDHIRKVKMGYYCEFCNKLFATPAKVGIHVSETQHNQNKGLQLLKRTPSGVTAVGNILISEAAWNGIVDRTCVLCNTEFESESIHKTGQSHVLNLIKTSIEFGNNYIYRKLDEETFHCLTCNEVLALEKLTNHFEHFEHLIKIQKHNTETGTKPKTFGFGKINGESKAETVRNEKKDSVKQDTKKARNLMSAKTPKEFDALLIETLKAKDYVKAHGDNGEMYCILCEWVLKYHDIPRHVRTVHHLTMLKMHNERLEEMSKVEEKPSKPEQCPKEQPSSDVKTSDENSNMNKVLESLPEFQKNDINIDLVSSTAICKKCSTHLGMDYDTIKTHIDEHKAKPTKKDSQPNLFQYSHSAASGKNTTLYTKPVFLNRNNSNEASTSRRSSVSSKCDEEIEAFASENNISYRNGKAYCNLCKTNLPTAMKNLREHVNGANHKYRVSAANNKALKPRGVKKVPIDEYVFNIVGVENMLFQDVVINEKICVNTRSFLFIKDNGHAWQCFSCNLTFSVEEIEKHPKSDYHRKIMTDSQVVEMDAEFIREIRPEVYHCGFCNSIETSWETMEEHLRTVQHRECKTGAEWRLRQHLPDIRKHSIKQRMKILAFLHMMAHQDNMSGSDSDSDWY